MIVITTLASESPLCPKRFCVSGIAYSTVLLLNSAWITTPRRSFSRISFGTVNQDPASSKKNVARIAPMYPGFSEKSSGIWQIL